jgi:hypothetical protein
MTDKRQRTMTETSFDMHIHTLVQQPPTVGCVRIVSPPDTVQVTKDSMISLIILADASGSMETGDRIQNLRSGIMRLGELSNQFASMQVELTIIQFNEVAGVVWGPAPMPSMEKLRSLCGDIKPNGGTNISHAIEVGLNIAEGRAFVGKSVHMVLFTDGVDASSLSAKLDNNTLPFIRQLKEQKRLTVHCVGICSDADANLLDKIVRSSCRGTFQCIRDVDISRLIGAMWGLMMEMVDQNVRLLVEIFDSDGSVSAVVSRDVILRVCSPSMPLVIGFKVQHTTTMIRARMVLEERCLDARLSLPRASGAAFDMVCAQEAVNLLQAELSEKIVVLLRAGNPADAIVEVGITRETIRALLEKVESEEQRAEFTAIVDAVMQELSASEANLLRALNDVEEGRETELREMSRCATARNSGVSIGTDTRSLSVLQRELSA